MRHPWKLAAGVGLVLCGLFAAAGAAQTKAERATERVAARHSRAAPSAAPADTQQGAEAAADPLTGEWDAVEKIRGARTEFTLRLKLEGKVVTGEAAWTGETLQIFNGTWVDGKLRFSVTYSTGETVEFGAVLEKAALVGSLWFDLGEPVAGIWDATRAPVPQER